MRSVHPPSSVPVHLYIEWWFHDDKGAMGAHTPSNMRILGIDYGERRIGMAMSDPTGTIAQPLPTLKRRRGKRPPLKAITEVAVANDVKALVMGLPLELSGKESDWTAEVRSVGDELGRRLDVPVHYVDERFTSARALKALAELGLSKTKRRQKERVDAAAAVLILQSWLDSRRSSGE